MKLVSHLGVAVAAACLLLGAAGWAAAGTDDMAEKEKQVDALFACVTGADAPGASVLVARDGKVLLAKGYGYANVEHHVPNTPQTKFRLASVTKQFTAAAILQLMEAGKLSLDDPVAKYLPDLPGGEKITLRHLLTHTSGMSHQATELTFEPGARIEYSNAGYFTLGKVIEKVSGQPYEEYMRQHVFAPLGMNDTGMDHQPTLLPHRAQGYMWDEKSKGYLNAPFEDAVSAGTAGGLYSTVEDMLRWSRALDQGTLLRPATVAQAFTKAKLANGSEIPYGFGWAIESLRGLKDVNHGGDITGFNTQISTFPDQHCTVIVLSNVWMRPVPPLPYARTLAHQIAEIYLDDAMQPADTRNQVHFTPEQMQAFAGHYKMTGRKEMLDVTGDVLTVEVVDGHLIGSDRVNRVELVPESDTTLLLKTDATSKLHFHKDDHGKITGVTINLMGLVELQGTRVE